LLSAPLAGAALVRPASLPAAQLDLVHGPPDVAAVRTGSPRRLAESSGIRRDPKVWQAVRSSNGGAMAAALAALRIRRNAGSLSSGLHHASRASGMGFCTFNGLALAAKAARDQRARVLIIDLDAHGGGGTYSIVKRWPGIVQLDLVVSSLDTYRPQASSTLDYIRDAADYLPFLRKRLATLDAGPGFDLVIYNAGVDPYEGCDIGGLSGMTAAALAERDRMVFAWGWRGMPVHSPSCWPAVMSATGCQKPRSRSLHRQTIAAAVSGLDPVAQRISVKAPGPFDTVRPL